MKYGVKLFLKENTDAGGRRPLAPRFFNSGTAIHPDSNLLSV